MPHARGVGREAEDLAAEHLLGLGFTLLTRRFACRGGELDLVALDGETLVFVEVRARKGGRFPPEHSVSAAKRDRILRASRRYLAEYEGPDRPVRYDLVAIDAAGIRHHRQAFEPE